RSGGVCSGRLDHSSPPAAVALPTSPGTSWCSNLPGGAAGSALALLEQGEGGVFDHVFLAANHAAAAHLDQDLPGRYAVLLLGALGEQQEGAVDAAVAHGQGVLVAADGEVHDRHHQVVGDVLDTEHVNAGLDTHARAH